MSTPPLPFTELENKDELLKYILEEVACLQWRSKGNVEPGCTDENVYFVEFAGIIDQTFGNDALHLPMHGPNI